jgi:hypothetical protein
MTTSLYILLIKDVIIGDEHRTGRAAALSCPAGRNLDFGPVLQDSGSR